MKKSLLICGLLCALAGQSLLAQEAPQAKKLSLEECIRLAGERSLEIQSKHLQSHRAKLQIQARQNAFLPNISAGISGSLNLGRSQDATGVTLDRSSLNSNLGVNANVMLFSGFARLHDLKSARLQLEASNADLEQSHWTLKQRVIQLYFALLYAKRVEEVAQSNLALYREQLDFASSYYKAGKWSLDKQADAKAQYASAELRLIEAQNAISSAEIDLMQALELREAQPIASLNVEAEVKERLPELEARLATQGASPLIELPSLRANRLQQEANKYQIKSAKAGYLPTLSLGAGYNNGYFHILTEKFKAQNLPFSTQWKNNGSWGVSLNLNIPIFNAFSTRTNIRTAKLEASNLDLQRRTLERQRDKDIDQARLSASIALRRIKPTEATLEAVKTSRAMTAEKWRLGRATATELAEANQRLLSADLDRLNALYEFALRYRLLELFYQ